MNIKMIKLMLAKELELKWKLIYELCLENLKEVIEEFGAQDAQFEEDALILKKHRHIMTGAGAVGHVDR